MRQVTVKTPKNNYTSNNYTSKGIRAEIAFHLRAKKTAQFKEQRALEGDILTTARFKLTQSASKEELTFQQIKETMVTVHIFVQPKNTVGLFRFFRIRSVDALTSFVRLTDNHLQALYIF